MILHHQDMYRTARHKQQEMQHAAKMDRWAREAKGSRSALVDWLVKAHSSLLSILL